MGIGIQKLSIRTIEELVTGVCISSPPNLLMPITHLLTYSLKSFLL